MQFDTLLKLGSLAIGVAQDEKVRELATLIHKGAKRRGIMAPLSVPPSTSSSSAKPQEADPAKPAAPALAKAKPTQSSTMPPIPFAPSNAAAFGLPPMGKMLTPSNAKKALEIASSVAGFLVK